ncbi:outer membrane beta-barrel protein [Algoriphagus hitonicola]|uniref:Outer membrane protein beta-barrel domain-containing protein n=1 Tax=Algoriphagus hitonicola TaxID=435880 RepID=A0A1I2W0E4_9BACT|nr:outer membrane beta-barrel protein [Algoriphagus hitonicola]SFG94850.1 Outer membrane protein beta-barrel domain-containing protein [Algoriphagus hitonicola]
MRFLLFLLLTAFTSLPALAQTSVGIRAGYTTSTYSYRPAANFRAISTEAVGKPTFAFVIEHFNSKNAGIELNLQLITLGMNLPNPDTDPVQRNITELDYLKMPLLASFFAGRSGRFQIKVGPHLGYLMDARDIQRDFTNSASPEIPTYGGADDRPKKLMYGLTGGAGISKLFGKSTLAGEVRFAYDFTNPEGQDRIFDMNSTNLEFTLAYLFRIRERN